MAVTDFVYHFTCNFFLWKPCTYKSDSFMANPHIKFNAEEKLIVSPDYLAWHSWGGRRRTVVIYNSVYLTFSETFFVLISYFTLSYILPQLRLYINTKGRKKKYCPYSHLTFCIKHKFIFIQDRGKWRLLYYSINNLVILDFIVEYYPLPCTFTLKM